jgi:uncharacterized protein (UPF0297 family)
MGAGTVEERLDRLEKVMGHVLSQLTDTGPRKKNWRRTIGMFDNDPLMKELLDDTLQAREQERTRFYKEHDGQCGTS